MSQTQYRKCPHEELLHAASYNTGESEIILCEKCYHDPGFVNEQDVDFIIDIETGKEAPIP